MNIVNLIQKGNKKWLGTSKNRPLYQSLQKETQGKELCLTKHCQFCRKQKYLQLIQIEQWSE